MKVAIATLAVVVGALLSATSPAGAQSATCAGHTQTAGVTRAFDSSANVTRITGTNRADVIVGTSGRDIIRALGGADIICGLGADDVVFAGKGADIVYGGSGADDLRGGQGSDTLAGGPGPDIINGQEHTDRLLGGDGSDTIFGEGGNDALFGGSGADVLHGQDGNDDLVGGPGADLLRGGSMNDTLNGGQGADTVRGNDGSDACTNRQSVDSFGTCETSRATSLTSSGPPVCNQASLSAYYTNQVGRAVANLEVAEARMLALINETRLVCGLEPLTTDALAANEAQAHSREMFNSNLAGVAPNVWFVHSQRWPTLIGLGDRFAVGENIAFVFPSVDPVAIHRNLINSGGHLCNILGAQYDHVGLGFTHFDSNARGLIVTQIFTGDSSIEATSSDLVVLDDLANPNSARSTCRV